MRTFINEEVLTEFFLDALIGSVGKLNENLITAWASVNKQLTELGLPVPAEPAPIVSGESFFRYDMRDKWSKDTNTFLIGVQSTPPTGVEGGVKLNLYRLGISYNRGKVLKEMKHDYYGFRIREAVIATVEGLAKESGAIPIGLNYNARIQIMEILMHNDGGFTLHYDIGK